MQDLQLTVTLPKARIIWALSTVVVLLISTHVVLQVLWYEFSNVHWLFVQLFDVDVEDSVPTWYSSIALLLAAALAYAKYTQAKRQTDRWSNYWLVMALGLAFLSLDEIAGFHETLNTLIEVSWAIPALGVLAICGLFYLRFLFALAPRVSLLLISAGLIFIGGAIGVELGTESYLEEDRLDTLAYNLWTGVEEAMEMAGVVLLIYTLLDTLERDRDPV